MFLLSKQFDINLEPQKLFPILEKEKLAKEKRRKKIERLE